MPEKLPKQASINYMIKMLGRLAYKVTNDSRPAKDAIIDHFEFTSEQYRVFLSAYNKAGDDPLEV